MKKRIIYVANDGKEFELEWECIVYEKSLISKCPVCKGVGGEHVDDGHDCWGNYEKKFVPCRYCKGTGEKDVQWEKRKRLLDKLDSLQQTLSTL